ncbi:MAG: phosphate ABC transporter ATP-binding protein PstB [Clostridiales bacterium]|jgi:phosphate transport system ATP-binding protein|nr:phosphate ABC transporter ATP-binding protein PstB [Clostridiales bacterium]
MNPFNAVLKRKPDGPGQNLITARQARPLKNPFGGECRIRIEGADLFYGSARALKNVCLSIESRRVTALIGPSGCGKSTLLRCLNRMNDQIRGCSVTGSFTIDGTDLYREVDVNLLRKNIGMVFQKPNVFPMSIYANMTYGPKTYGVTARDELNRIVEDGLKEANLWDEVKDRLKESALSLSGGQQQRLCIARCLSINPKVILMDEPTSSLDPISTSKIEELICALKKDYTIVVVTHNMHQALRVADKTAFFLLGDLIEYGDTSQIFRDPQNDETKKYISGVYS